MCHPPGHEPVSGDDEHDLRVAAAFLNVMRLQVVDRDDMDFARPDPARPPPVAWTGTAELGAVDGIDDHADRGHASMYWSMTACHCIARTSSPAARACFRCSPTKTRQRPIRAVFVVVAISDLPRHGKERPVRVIGAQPTFASSHGKGALRSATHAAPVAD